METESSKGANSDQEPVLPPEQNLPVIEQKKEIKSLADFTEEQMTEIESKRQILSSLAYFIGKDFNIPVELNEPGKGWHWDFKENKIRVDPIDMLEKSMDFLRFVICHEGGHRRISRNEHIPLEEWRQPGFSFMMNVIEDPRDNNFVAENYPRFKEQMAIAYGQDSDFEKKSKEKAGEKLGHTPRFVLAGFEYIKQWFNETQGQDFELSVDLPDDVKTVVEKTLKSAQDSWWRYPSRQETDDPKKGEKNIKDYAKLSYQINRDEIWPDFKKLVEADIEDQKQQELLKDAQKQQGDGKEGLPQGLKDKLTPEEQKELGEAIEKSIKESLDKSGETAKEKEKREEQGESPKPIDLDKLSEGLKQKLREHINSLPEEEQKGLEEKAVAALKEFEKSLNEDLQGKLLETPEDTTKEAKSVENEDKEKDEDWEKTEKENAKKRADQRKKMESILETGKKGIYEKALETTADLIDKLTADLRDVFIKRKEEKYESGYRSGRKWNIRKRIREKIENIPLFKTEAREQPESESEEMDYAVTLMVDLSGSMESGHKIQEAFKSAVILAETLNNLGVKFEIVGFQDILLEFKSFEDSLDDRIKEKLAQMVLEVSGKNPGGHNNPQDNDDGACLEKASESLANQSAKNKVLFVISDGIPEASYKSRARLSKELKEAVASISSNTKQKIIGLGLNSKAVEKYYPNNISGVSAKEMAETLAGLLREVIEKY